LNFGFKKILSRADRSRVNGRVEEAVAGDVSAAPAGPGIAPKTRKTRRNNFRGIIRIHFNPSQVAGPKTLWIRGKDLARISHHPSTAAADPGVSTALRFLGRARLAKRRIHARLHRLATKYGEKRGLAKCESNPTA